MRKPADGYLETATNANGNASRCPCAPASSSSSSSLLYLFVAIDASSMCRFRIASLTFPSFDHVCSVQSTIVRSAILQSSPLILLRNISEINRKNVFLFSESAPKPFCSVSSLIYSFESFKFDFTSSFSDFILFLYFFFLIKKK